MKLHSIRQTSIWFFALGSLLFLIFWAGVKFLPLIVLALAFLVFAAIYNLVILIKLIIDLIKHDRLDSFFGICLVLANYGFASLYIYLLIHFI